MLDLPLKSGTTVVVLPSVSRAATWSARLAQSSSHLGAVAPATRSVSTTSGQSAVSAKPVPLRAAASWLQMLSRFDLNLSLRAYDSSANDLFPTTEMILKKVNRKRPVWSNAMSLTVPIYRQALHHTRKYLRSSRLVATLIPATLPKDVRVHPTKVPRRDDLLLAGMTPSEAQGSIPGEWIYHEPACQQAALVAGNDPAKEKVVLFLHGGAYFMCSAEGHRMLTWRFSKESGAKVLAINYRLSPEHTFPLPLHDAISAYLDLIDPKDPSQRRYTPDQIVIAGDSAGGGLAVATTLWLRDNNYPLPSGVVALAPWLDLTHSQPSFRINGEYDYVPSTHEDPLYIVPGHRSHYYTKSDAENKHPLVSPLFAHERRDRLMPPTLIHVGELERLRDESIVFAGRVMKNSPIKVEMFKNQVHVFQAFAHLGEAAAQASLQKIGRFVQNPSSAEREFVVVDDECPDVRDGQVVSLAEHRYSVQTGLDLVEEGRMQLGSGVKDCLQDHLRRRATKLTAAPATRLRSDHSKYFI
ncbi:Alpha/Beta hydrolase protein [Polychytrium aggregatum]|uniref:Alpha/Beta hydrolase protein n=1 Tax=Polychytrium aggregatum TaxID=110093 RepID=UPI0022FE3317|nr:Alpha/Beta hydrolase protein [Polychytrium aggregatum]KAI9199244.1 Alpha/Beta hydrolase protein [Polychytrium aggregatum]